MECKVFKFFFTFLNIFPQNLTRMECKVVGEEGPELVELPRGSKVYTNQETKDILSRGNTFIFQVIMDEVSEVLKLVKVAREAEQMSRAGRLEVV